jgi:hypothetical protein
MRSTARSGVGCKDAQPLMTQDRELLAININSRPNTECQPPKKMIMEPPFGPLSPDGARKSRLDAQWWVLIVAIGRGSQLLSVTRLWTPS